MAKQYSAPPGQTIDLSKRYAATLETSAGAMTLELFASEAPVTVNNFLFLARDGFYDGVIFHRVIKGFMIQGGGFENQNGNFVQKPTGAPIKNEAANGLKNRRGTLAMARTSDPHSASSQFFINVANNAFLDYTAPNPRGYGYCVFGKVIEGFATVDKIKAVRTGRRGGHADVPEVDVLIERAEIIE